ncbi:glycoside hydrolase, partial [Marasmius fiardii PR-910]
YTWSPFTPTDLHGYKPAPMLWGENQIDDFHANVKQGSADHILGFNEPEMDGQSNLTPQHAADLWKQHIQPYAGQGFKLVSPAVTSAPQSKPWLSDFFKACDDCTFDAVAVHYYDTSPEGLINYITDFHNTFNKPIWLTEYACQNFNNGPQCSPDDVTTFMKKVKTFAENTDWVQQYCWFGAMHDMVNVNTDNQLMNGDGTPNALGQTFLGLSSYSI